LDEVPRIAVAARRSNADIGFTPEQTAWVARVQLLGQARASTPLDVPRLTELASSLAQRLEGPDDLRFLNQWLSECGVVLVIELPLRNSKMDGVASLATGTPIIGLSTRGNRMDSFVFTLLHEIAHLTLGHVDEGGLRIDEDLESGADSDREKEANETAARWIFDQPLVEPEGGWTPRAIVETARVHGVHPCFVVGRLQKEGKLDWSQFRRSIPKVRPFVNLG
jgi:HTH-type transcriptional regulator/antitoxin HigA